MLVAAILNGLRIVTALAVMVSAVPSQRAGLASHDHGRAYGQEAAVNFGQVAGHTHSHSHDNDFEDKTALPPHGHEHADHSHVAFGVPAPPSTSLPAPEGRLVRAREHCPAAADPPFRLDRPPCLPSCA